MSAVKISVQPEAYGVAQPRTTVRVDGRFAYQSGHAVAVERENLKRLVEALQIDNVEVDES